jgi:voltage-gated potassium channel
MMDLAGLHGAVSLHEREVTREEIGRPLSAIATGLGLRIYRKGQRYGFWQPEAQSLETGDKIIEVVPFEDPLK